MTQPTGTAWSLIQTLKIEGNLTGQELAREHQVSTEAIRQHLSRLKDDGFIDSESRAVGRGRPKLFWSLTRKGHGLFPDSHSTVFVGFLDSIRETLGADALEKLIAERADKTKDLYQGELASCRSTGEKITRLAELRDQEGYMAEVRKEGDSWILLEHHCPICSAATSCQGFCSSELDLFKSVLPECDVERVEHLLEDSSRCSYRISGKRSAKGTKSQQ